MHPFRLEVPDSALVDLHERIARVRWPSELPGVGWERGVPVGYLRELAEYWRTTYDWRRQEALLNGFPQFTTTVDGTGIHFLHVRSPEPDALPLVLTHGWPGSVVEFLDVLGPLTDPRAHGRPPSDAFHVVAPSLPGFTLSGPVPDVGWDVRRTAAAWSTLMARLGYERYGAQGGDWGAKVSWELGARDPRVVGVHVTMLAATAPADTDPPSDEARVALAAQAYFQDELSGYVKLQSTRPQTLAYGLTDSPVGQLAWIVERFKEWSDCDTLPEDAVDRDRMLTNVMLYWLTGTAGSSAQLYYEYVHGGATWGAPPPTEVPTGVAVFRHDTVLPIRHTAERAYPTIVHWSEFDRGGHFAAMEEPDLLVSDVADFFRPMRRPGGTAGTAPPGRRPRSAPSPLSRAAGGAVPPS